MPEDRSASDSELLIRNGYIGTMDPNIGDLRGADVRISGGVIAEVGVGLAPTSAAQ
jgi:hypothetical protein